MTNHHTAKWAGLTFSLAFAVTQAASGQGTINATLNLIGSSSSGGYQYTATLANDPSSTDPIQTLWMSWIPGYNFLPSQPSAISTPIGWTAYLIGGSGYSIEFTAQDSAYEIDPGGSLNFGFSSTDSPDTLNNNSPLFPNFPALYSFVYSGSASGAGVEPSSDSAQVTGIVEAPEPATWALFVVGAGLLFALRPQQAEPRGH